MHIIMHYYTFALTGSSLSVMVIVSQWRLLAYSPLEAIVTIEKYRFLFCGYIIIPISIASIQPLLPLADDDRCFMFDSNIHITYFLAFILVAYCLQTAVGVVTICLSIYVALMTEWLIVHERH